MFDTVNSQLLLKQALGWGINFWDTAEAYGNGLSEEGYGRFFSRNPEARKEVVLTTKLVAKEGKLTERLDAALSRLKTPSVDLFYIHSVTNIAEMDGQIRDWAQAMMPSPRASSTSTPSRPGRLPEGASTTRPESASRADSLPGHASPAFRPGPVLARACPPCP